MEACSGEPVGVSLTGGEPVGVSPRVKAVCSAYRSCFTRGLTPLGSPRTVFFDPGLRTYRIESTQRQPREDHDGFEVVNAEKK